MKKGGAINFLFIFLAGLALFGLGYAMNGLYKHAQLADRTSVAVQLARQKMEEALAQKAGMGYDEVGSQAPQAVYSGQWYYSRDIISEFVDPDSFKPVSIDMGYKLLTVRVAWGLKDEEVLTLQTLVTRQVPGEVKGSPYLTCR